MNDEEFPTKVEESASEVGEPVLQDAPLVAIAQSSGSKRPAEVAEGQWYCPGSGEALGKKLVLVPVAQFETRSYFPKEGDPNFDAGAKFPRCSSFDAQFPITGESPEHRDQSGESTTVDNCPACAFGRWRTSKEDKKKRRPPLCALAINFFGVVYQEDGGSRVAMLRFAKTGFKPAQAMLQSFAAQFPPKPLHATAIEMTIAGPFGAERGQRYYEPRLRSLGATEKHLPGTEASFRKLLAAWPALHARVRAKVATQSDEEPELEIPF